MYLLASLCACLMTIPASPAVAAPRLVSDEPVYDFDTAYSGTELVHSFILRNEGDAPLTIHRVHSSCGCTVADLKNTTLPPWGEELLAAKVSLKNRHGPQRVNITVHSDDPEYPVLRLSIEGRAIHDFQVRPQLLNYGIMPPGAPVTRTLDLISDDEPFSLQDIASTLTGLGLRVSEVKPGHHYRLAVTLAEDGDLGVIEGNLRIRTDHPRRPEITVPFTANITYQRLIVSPEALTLPDTWEGALTRHIVIRSAGGAPFTIENIEAPHPDIQVRTFPMGDVGYRFQVSNLRADQFEGRNHLTITTDIPDSGPAIIPVSRGQPPITTTRLAGGGANE